MNTTPPGIFMNVSSLAVGISILALLTACGSNPAGKPIAEPVSAPSKVASHDPVPIVSAPNTAATAVTPPTSSSEAATAGAIATIPVPSLPLPALPVPDGGTPATITQTDVGPLTSGQIPNVAGVEVQDNYIYYPAFGIYYSGQGHQYHYQQHEGWVARPVPEGVTLDVLRASPSVPMEFHDAPSRHHAAIVRQYPKTWSPDPVH
jgi:hypothetical protein